MVRVRGSSCRARTMTFLAAEVAHGDLAALDCGERAVAAVGGGPDGAADGGGGVAAAGAEAASGVGAQAADRAPRELGGRGARGRAGARGAAALEARALEAQLGQAPRARLRDCSTWNRPAVKSPDWVLPAAVGADELDGAALACRGTTRPGSGAPRSAARSAGPSGSPAAPRRRGRRAGGTAINTGPSPTGPTFTSSPISGSGSPQGGGGGEGERGQRSAVDAALEARTGLVRDDGRASASRSEGAGGGGGGRCPGCPPGRSRTPRTCAGRRQRGGVEGDRRGRRGTVDAALEGRARLARAERERGCGVVRRSGRARVDRGLGGVAALPLGAGGDRVGVGGGRDVDGVGPGVEVLVMPLKVTRTWSPAATSRC